jgi:hypothetical protein
VAAAATAVVAGAKRRKGANGVSNPTGATPFGNQHVRSYVCLTSADRPGLLLRTDIITALRRISRARRFREARQGRATRSPISMYRISEMDCCRPAVSCLAYEAGRTRGDADHRGGEGGRRRHRGMDFIPRNVRQPKDRACPSCLCRSFAAPTYRGVYETDLTS